jgi:hypothetical protein
MPSQDPAPKFPFSLGWRAPFPLPRAVVAILVMHFASLPYVLFQFVSTRPTPGKDGGQRSKVTSSREPSLSPCTASLALPRPPNLGTGPIGNYVFLVAALSIRVRFVGYPTETPKSFATDLFISLFLYLFSGFLHVLSEPMCSPATTIQRHGAG